MEDTMSEDIAEQAQENTQTEQPSYDLTVQDLNAIKTIIDAAAQRGAFKPAEMEVVGKTYNKLVGFLTTIAKGGQNG
jgi:hypothetical protein